MGPQSAGQEGLRSSGAAGVTLDAVPVRGLAAGHGKQQVRPNHYLS